MSTTSRKVRFVCISDTHNHGPGDGYKLPKGDVFIHAGDLTSQGTRHELEKAAAWLAKAEFAVKIVVAGNHDLSLDPNYVPDQRQSATLPSGAGDNGEECRRLMSSIPDLIYLQHEGAEIHVSPQQLEQADLQNDIVLRVFGSPYSPARSSSRQKWAFQYAEEEADSIWSDIPTKIDILITHTPPAGYRDTSQHWHEGGCTALTPALWKTKPALHICGHCHEGRGAQVLRWSEVEGDVESVSVWEDSSVGTKKQALFDLTGKRGGQLLERPKETAVINAAIMAKSHDTGRREFNKPIVVDVNFPVREIESIKPSEC